MTVKPPSPTYVGPPRRHGGGGNKPIKRIVVHCTAGAEPGFKGAARAIGRYFQITDRAASAHYAADSRESVQCAWDSIVCYHAPPNGNSIGYELCCSLSNEGKGHWGNADHKAMLAIAAKDIARLCLAYGIPTKRVRAWGLRRGKQGICGHADVRDAWHQTSHWDPGPHFPWGSFMRQVRREARALKQPAKAEPKRAAKPKVKKPPSPSRITHAREILARAKRAAKLGGQRRRRINRAIDKLPKR